MSGDETWSVDVGHVTNLRDSPLRVILGVLFSLTTKIIAITAMRSNIFSVVILRSVILGGVDGM